MKDHKDDRRPSMGPVSDEDSPVGDALDPAAPELPKDDQDVVSWNPESNELSRTNEQKKRSGNDSNQ